MPKLGEIINGSLKALTDHGLTARRTPEGFVDVYIQGLDLEPMGARLGRFVGVEAAVKFFMRKGWPEPPKYEPVPVPVPVPEKKEEKPMVEAKRVVSAPRGAVALVVLDHMIAGGQRQYTNKELSEVVVDAGGAEKTWSAMMAQWRDRGLIIGAGKGAWIPAAAGVLKMERDRVALGRKAPRGLPTVRVRRKEAPKPDAPPMEGLSLVGHTKAGVPVYLNSKGTLVIAKVILEEL